MNYKIAKSTTNFLMGISDISLLNKWLDENQSVKGICFAGRSNVGKSSLINSLFGKSTARVSKTPGRTREINTFTFNFNCSDTKELTAPFYLFDLPGYGFASVSKTMSQNWNKLMYEFFIKMQKNILIISIQDARHTMQQTDSNFLDFISKMSYEKLILFNKFDKLKNQKEKNKANIAKKDLTENLPGINDIIMTSAIKNIGIDSLEKKIEDYLLG